MNRTYLACGLAAGLLLAGPVGWRVLTWERSQPTQVDLSQARAGETLFNHEWQRNDPLSKRGDGLGPVFNARSCVACHHLGGAGGAGGVEHNVTTFVVTPEDGRTEPRQGVLHAQAWSPEYRETLKHLHPNLPPISQPTLAQISLPRAQRGDVIELNEQGRGPAAGRLALPNNVQLSQRNTPALFGASLIDSIPDRVIIANERRQRLAFGMADSDTESVPVGKAHRLPDGKIGRFGWKAQTARLKDFVEAACANELGLSNPTHQQPASLAKPDYVARGIDLSQAQCDQLTAFVAVLPRPVERAPAAAEQKHAEHGKVLFSKIGCANCHTPDLGSVEGLYSDLLLHRMGMDLQGGGESYGGSIRPLSPGESDLQPLPDEWRTPPLWGVADSAPYMHDGRAATLIDAIRMHDGQAARSAREFAALRPHEQNQLLTFLRTLKAP